MNPQILYRWQEEISRHFTSFTAPQRKRLALFSLGVMQAEHCHQLKIAKVLPKDTDPENTVRQLRRCISDKKWSVVQFSLDWTRWVMSCIGSKELVLLVDETKIGKHFRAMMVGLAYKKRCIPLIWRCYKGNSAADYPEEGQVKMIAAMLGHLKTALPNDRRVLVLADRGIGNSPALCRAVDSLGWRYLFRIPNTVKIITARGALLPCEEIKKGGRWGASGIVFITKGQILTHIRAIWDKGCAEPWILVTNDPNLTGREYAKRNWQEQGFRDLKSNGWQLDACRLRSVERMAQFLAILVLAQGAALWLGSLSIITGKARRLIKTKDGKLRRPLSLFKEGLVYFNKHIIGQGKFPSLYFINERRLC